jgi:AAA family ATP:ADP antiporter
LTPLPLLYRLLRAQPHELPALAWSFAYFFLVLCSYYLLRPVRDTVGVALGRDELQRLFTVTFAVMLLLVPVFGWLSARLPRARLLPVVYGFFSLNLMFFAVSLPPAVFFVWLSVFNLFVVSVFWSFMSDVFETAQAARLYGAIAAGGSCGAITGPLIASIVLKHEYLLVLSALLLAAAIVCILMLSRWSTKNPRKGDPPPDQPIGGSIVAGIRAALSSPFLLAICGYLFCYTALSTALYFHQVAIVREALPDPREQTRFFARFDLVVNSLTLAIQLLAFSRLASLIGVTGLLIAMPLVSIAGFLWIGATPTLAALVVFGVTRRVGEFALSKPARETLFTAVPREDRYKAKNFIDTVVYRGGDVAAAWAFASLPAFFAAGVAVAWTALGAFLGARMKSWTRDDARSSPSLRQPGAL